MKRPVPRELLVSAVVDLTPNMRRVSLTGGALSDFPAGSQGGYVKLFIEDTQSNASGVRTYTIRQQHANPAAIDVDFVLHGDHGLAAAWAQRVRQGDRIRVGGPGAASRISNEGDWYFLVADMTALPALSVHLESLPDDATGHVVIEVIDGADEQVLCSPPGIEIHWVVNPVPGCGDALVARVRDVPWMNGVPAVWCACEFDSMRQLRRYFRKEREVPRALSYVSSYWKQGVAEDEHKKLKKVDNDQDALHQMSP